MSPAPVHLLAIGELLWDIFPDQQRLGGAPANFAIHYSQLCGDHHRIALASAVGDDEPGKLAMGAIGRTGVNTELITTTNRPTGQVNITLDGKGSPCYEIAADAAWDHLRNSSALAAAAARARAICFGTLAQRGDQSRGTIQKTVAATAQDCLRILDINLRPTMEDHNVLVRSLELANVLKLNDEELPVLAKQFSLTGDAESQLKQLQRQFRLNTIAYTRGEKGAVLLRASEISHGSGFPVKVVGAGDAFTAVLAAGLLENWPLHAINRNACKIAAFVCSQPGATPNTATVLRVD